MATNVLDTPEQITAYTMLTLRTALKLECLGMARHGRSAYVIVKERHGFKGNKASVLSQYEELLRSCKVLV